MLPHIPINRNPNPNLTLSRGAIRESPVPRLGKIHSMGTGTSMPARPRTHIRPSSGERSGRRVPNTLVKLHVMDMGKGNLKDAVTDLALALLTKQETDMGRSLGHQRSGSPSQCPVGPSKRSPGPRARHLTKSGLGVSSSTVSAPLVGGSLF